MYTFSTCCGLLEARHIHAARGEPTQRRSKRIVEIKSNRRQVFGFSHSANANRGEGAEFGTGAVRGDRRGTTSR